MYESHKNSSCYKKAQWINWNYQQVYSLRYQSFLYTLLLWKYIVKLFEYWLNQDTETLIQQENICSLYTFLYYTCLKQNSRKFPYENASNDVVRADRMVDRTRLSLSLGEIRWK